MEKVSSLIARFENLSKPLPKVGAKALSSAGQQATALGSQPVGTTTAPCPPVYYELIELVEVVTQNPVMKWVKGPAMATADAATLPNNVERTDKSGANFKQYINLDPDLEGAAKRHPEYGRVIQFRARVKQTNGNTDQLAGVTVDFSYTRTDGPARTNTGTNPVWALPLPPPVGTPAGQPGPTGTENEGFSNWGGAKTANASTDAKGWTTTPVSFFVSQYGGDSFEISAKLAPGTSVCASTQPLKTTAKYVVWRKFWYQLTHALGYTPPTPTAAKAAYEEVFAEMAAATPKTFEKTDLPADLQGRTFFKEYMLKVGGSATKDVAVIGGHNKEKFAAMRTVEAAHPLKANLIVCEFQCDPDGATDDSMATAIFKLDAGKSKVVTLTQGSGGDIVCKPALKAGGNLVEIGEWSTSDPALGTGPGGGTITDADIEIESTRGSTLEVKVTLPASAPIPTTAAPVWVTLQLKAASGYLGESFGTGQILCVYDVSAAAGGQGSEVDYNDTVAHELGHMWKQTPKPGTHSASMNDHPLQYVGHQGQGSHCRQGATISAPGPVHWNTASEKTPYPKKGKCLMFHSFSSSCTHKFCATCKPYLQLQDMSSL